MIRGAMTILGSSLSKVCTSITAATSREYAFTHAFDAIQLYKEQYVDYCLASSKPSQR